MKRLTETCMVAWALLGCGHGLAAVTVIDFESLASLEVADDQFLSLDTDFNGSATCLSKSAGTLYYPNYPPYSGDKVLSGPSGVIKADAVTGFWAMAGAYVTGATNVTLTAYASDGDVLGVDATGGANYVGAPTGLSPNIFLSVSAPGIAYVEFSDSSYFYTIDDFTFERVIVVEIDIKPGSVPNSVNPKKKGKTPVAVLTTSITDGDSVDFDASTVDPATVKFGPSEAAPVHWALKDVDGDGDIDMILQFVTRETGIADGDTEASLLGKDLGGTDIVGTDSVQTSGPP